MASFHIICDIYYKIQYLIRNRISFSGELAYEVNVESNYGLHLWKKIMDVGSEFGVQPYGTEALSTLRIEMGHVAGPELDGRNIPYDVGLNGMVSQKKERFVKFLIMKKKSLGLDIIMIDRILRMVRKTLKIIK